MRDGWTNRWGWRISAVVLVGGVLALGTGTVVTQASEFEEANNKHQQNPFQRILHKLDKILDAIKAGGGSEGNHTLRWDQVLPVAQRFVVLAAFNNEAVLDKETGLVWEKAPSPVPVDTWTTARGDCAVKSIGTRKGWRLPSVIELSSLVYPATISNPTLPTGHPFTNVQTAIYWSATTEAENVTFAWVVAFSDGTVGVGNKTSERFQVWCVRGPMQESTY
jgi:Protein of unknown function (DUF1566)